MAVKDRKYNFIRDDLETVKCPEFLDAVKGSQDNILANLDKSLDSVECWKLAKRDTLRTELLKNQAGHCFYCGETIQDKANAELDHIEPKKDVTLNKSDSEADQQEKLDTIVSAGNLVIACPGCNKHKSSSNTFIDPYTKEKYGIPIAEHFEGLYSKKDPEYEIPLIIRAKDNIAENHIKAFRLNSTQRVAYRMRNLLCKLFIEEHNKIETP